MGGVFRVTGRWGRIVKFVQNDFVLGSRVKCCGMGFECVEYYLSRARGTRCAKGPPTPRGVRALPNSQDSKWYRLDRMS